MRIILISHVALFLSEENGGSLFYCVFLAFYISEAEAVEAEAEATGVEAEAEAEAIKN